MRQRLPTMEDSHSIIVETMPSSVVNPSPATVVEMLLTMDDAHSANIDLASSAPQDPFVSKEVQNLVQKINAGSSALDKGGEVGRKQLLADATALCLALETPIETLLRITWSQVLSTIAHYTRQHGSLLR